ncbi:MAG: hypothetical protein OSJ32_03725 [Muribaculaceae bacterium]|nr:hypothetical protein [Muribaculaceae bacterium]
MKKLILFSLFGLLFASTLPAQNIPGMSSTNPVTQKIPKTKNTTRSDRHRAPDARVILFSYDSLQGKCVFQFPDCVNSISITLTNEYGDVWYGVADRNNPAWNISLDMGDYNIVCIADDGSEFEGLVTID